MITLLTFPGRWGLESLSPFCMKAEVYLRLAKLPYVAKPADPRRTPKGKLPVVIDEDGTTIADSQVIIEHLERKHGAPLDKGLDEAQRARAHVVRRTFEEGLYFVALWSRWAEESGWEVSKGFFDPVPAIARWAVAPIVRRQLVRSTFAQGTGRHTRDEIYEMGRQDLAAFTTLLGDGPFVLGERLTTVDTCAYAFLANIIKAEIDTPLKSFATSQRALVSYVDRVSERVAAAKA